MIATTRYTDSYFTKKTTYCSNPSRGLSAIAEFLVFLFKLVRPEPSGTHSTTFVTDDDDDVDDDDDDGGGGGGGGGGDDTSLQTSMLPKTT